MIKLNASFLQTLYQQLPVLVQHGIISEETSNKIKTHYGPYQTPDKSTHFLVIFGILGTFLVSTGLILLIGYNWSGFSRSAKTVIAFMPLVLSMGVNLWGLLKKKTQATFWKESAALFWMASIGISIALISQTYHIPGRFERFLMVWMGLSLPILYLHRSLSTLIGYILGSMVWVIYTRIYGLNGHTIGYILLTLGALPMIVHVFQCTFRSIKPYILTWIGLPLLALGLSFTFDYAIAGIWIPLFGLLFSLIYLLSNVYPKSQSIVKQPLNVLGGVSIWMMTLVLGFNDVWWGLGRKLGSVNITDVLLNATNSWFDYATLAFLVVSVLVLMNRLIGNIDSKEFMIMGAFGLICLVAYGVLSMTQNVIYVVCIPILFSLFGLYLGVYRIIEGSKTLNYFKMNTGFAMVSSIIFLRFFDSSLSLGIRGIVFIALGVAFWFGNTRVLKRNAQKDG